MNRIVIPKKKLQFLLPPWILNSKIVNFTALTFSSVLPSQSLHLNTDYEALFHSIEECKRSANFGTTSTTHAKIIKHGYGMYRSLMSSLVSAYVSSERLNLAHQLLNETSYENYDVFSINLILASFTKVGAIHIAKEVFHRLTTRDVVTWNTMIGGCVKTSLFKDALTIFREMLRSPIEPDGFTFASVITGCAKLGALDHAKWVHGLMIEKRIELNDILCAALIDMYAKCGRIDTARSIFHSIQPNDVSVYNAMINGLAIHGLALDATSIFSEMEAQNIRPDFITFLGILTACSHGGLVEQGRKYFDLMQRQYLIQPQLEHYGAMVDLLSRAGLLEEAYKMIKEMPVDPDVVIWRTFLSSCRTHKNSELGEVALRNISNLGSGDYILLSNIYSSVKKWDDADKLRHTMKKNGVRKNSGKSWIEMAGAVHQFKAGDKSHPEKEGIYKLLKRLIVLTRMEGFVSDTELVLMDVSEEEKEENLNYHSEKLALAYGIFKSSPGSEIKITKNLRTCPDCHSWMKMVSKVLNRVIVVRDRIRFHRFEAGSCTCGDYW